MPDIAAALDQARGYLQKQGIENAPLEAEVLLAHCTGLTRVGLYRDSRRQLTARELESFWDLVKRRAAREPVAYLIGHREFMGLDFLVNPDVLIPRPETELLVETALVLLKGAAGSPSLPDDKDKGEPFLLLADVGTGSGAIAVSLAHYLPGSRIYATDLSSAALEVARKNALRQGVAGRIIFLEGDLLVPVKERLQAGRLSLITANLPYIPTKELGRLMPDVRHYEPVLALDGGCDGLALYRRLIPQARELLIPGGHLLMEIDPAQVPLIAPLLPSSRWRFEIRPDLAGRPRLVVATKDTVAKPL